MKTKTKRICAGRSHYIQMEDQAMNDFEIDPATKVVIGREVYAAQKARKIAALGDKTLYPSEPLVRFQKSEAQRRIIAAEIVESIYGWSLRYASGLQNFGIIRGCRSGDLDGSYEAAFAAAVEWQSADPDRRYVKKF